MPRALLTNPLAAAALQSAGKAVGAQVRQRIFYQERQHRHGRAGFFGKRLRQMEVLARHGHHARLSRGVIGLLSANSLPVIGHPAGTDAAGVDDFQYLFLWNAETTRQAQGFAHHDGIGYREKVAHDFRRSPGTKRTDVKQILGHGLEGRLAALENRCIAADEKRQLALACRDFTSARHWGVDDVNPALRRRAGQFAAQAGRHGAVNRDDSAGRQPRDQTGIAATRQAGLAHLLIGEHGDADEIRRLPDSETAIGTMGAQCRETRDGFGAQIAHRQWETGAREILRHPLAHVAQADEAEFQHNPPAEAIVACAGRAHL